MRVRDWPRYHYKGTVLDVYDGDTFYGDIDLGMGVGYKTWIRIVGVDTPELKGKGVSTAEKGYAELARIYLETHYLPVGGEFYIHTYRDDEQLDRLLGDIMIPVGPDFMASSYEMQSEPYLMNIVDDFTQTVYAVRSTAKGPKWREVYTHLLEEG